MDHAEQIRYLKKVFRAIGLYCLTVSVGLFVLGTTSPNGVDHGFHLYLTIIWGLMLAIPFVLGLAVWLYFEFYGHKRVRFADDA